MQPSTRHADDRRLVERVLSGDEVATARFVERMACVPAILRTRLRHGSVQPSAEEFEELVQSVLTAIWSRLGSFRGESILETWAYGFCTNEVFKLNDRRVRESRVIHSEQSELAATPECDRMAYEYVHRAIESLGSPSSAVVRLKQFENLTFTEVGECLEMSPNTAKTLYYRGLRKLRKLLAPHQRMDRA